MVLRHAFAIAVDDTEIILRWSISLFGSEPILPNGLGMVLRHARAIVVHDTKVVLRTGVPLIGS